MGTATVQRTDLAAREQLGGSLGYAGRWDVVHGGRPGILTAVPPLGQTVQRGQILYEMDGRPVRLLFGGRPAWRDLKVGVDRGEDVRQLEENLAALGFMGTPADGGFTASTAAAILRWQARLGEQRTGRLPLGSIVFLPEAMRVAAVTTPVGGHVGAESLLRTTSTRRVVAVDVPTSRQGNVSPGGQVMVTLPGGIRLTAKVAEVGRVAVSGQGNGAPPTVTVTATLDQPDAAGTLDQVPVQVSVTTAERKGVLAVPVTALLAASSGGYRIKAGTDAITVRPGLFDEVSGLIEISGDGLVEGMTVEVPAR
jgi:peptidoglycan hydrolase-like protein with peptidoglycan-binding domain